MKLAKRYSGVGLLMLSSLCQEIGAAEISFSRSTIDSANPANPHCKTVGDIDGDGYIDVLAASSSGGGMYWYRYPNWSKYSIAAGSFTTDMQTGDIDGDGDLDVIIPDGSALKWFRNPRPSGDPSRDPWVATTIGAAGANNHDVEVADINRDGRLDVVSRRKEGGGTYVWIQNSPSSWTQLTVSTADGEGLSLGDIDGDGDLDLALNGFWLENPGHIQNVNWTARTIDNTWPPLVGVLVVDLNRDGRNDVVLAPSESSGFRFAWYESTNPRGGSWTMHVIDSSVSYFHTFKAGDIDNDGDTDLITAEMQQSTDPDEVSVYRNDGGALTWSKQVVATTGSHNIRIADIGRDGDLDIIGANWDDSAPNSAIIEMWENRSAQTAGSSLDNWQLYLVDGAMPWTPIVVTAGDIDGDGKLDLISGGSWYKNSGRLDSGWQRRIIGGNLKNVAWVDDFDGDGDLDIFGTDGTPYGGNLSWAQNDGRGNFTIYNNVAFGQDTFFQGAVGGVFSAGKPYVMVMQWEDGEFGKNAVEGFTKPANPTTGTWTKSILNSKSLGEQMSIGDIDNDGDLDLFQGSYWLRNDGNAWTSFRATTFASGQGGADRNVLVDIDRDGDLDAVVGLSHFDGNSVPLYWLEHPADPTQPWPQHVVKDAAWGGHSLDAKDIDRDGDIDIVLGEHRGARRAWVLENVNNGARWVEHLLDPGAEGRDHHNGTLLFDLDGDGDLDIVSIGWDNWKLWVFENTSSGGSTPPPPSPPPPPAPPGVPTSGLAMWLKADAGVVTSGSAVTQWQDQSGNSVHAAQTDRGSQPTLVSSALNGLPVVQFDGADDFLTFTQPVDGLTAMTLCIVAANTSDRHGGHSEAENAALFWNESSGWGSLYVSPFQNKVQFRFGTTQSGNSPTYSRRSSLGAAYSTTIAVKNGTTDTLYVDGTLALEENGKLGSVSGCQTTGNVGRGYDHNTYFPGRIAEVLVYRRALSEAERQGLESYLRDKYFTISNPPSPPSEVPTSGLAVWLRADAGVIVSGSTVSQWQDQSGNGLHASQSKNNSQPTLIANAINGRPAIQFDGANDFVSFPLAVNGLTGMTLALVSANSADRSGGPSEAETAALYWNQTQTWGTVYLGPFQSKVQFRFGTTQTGNSPTYTRPTSVGAGYTTSIAIKNGSTDALYVDGMLALQESGKFGSIAACQDTGNVGLGHNSTYFPGRVAEVLIYRRALSDSERQSLEGYLRAKYFASQSSQQVATPTITPNGGSYNGPVSVTLQSTTSAATIRYTLDGTTPSSSSTLYSGPFQLNSSGTVSARAFKSGLTDSQVATASFTINGAEVPTTGLALWLKADAGIVTSGSTISQWQDQSGNGVHATQASSGSQPTLLANVVNGKPAVQFDGANDFLTFAMDINGTPGLTLCLVSANTSDRTSGQTGAENAALFWDETQNWGTVYLSPFQSGVQFRFGTAQKNNQPVYVRPASIGANYSISTTIKNGSTDTLYVNGAEAHRETAKQNTIAGCQPTGNIGRGLDGNTYFPGRIAEVLIYRRALSDSERQSLDAYLTNKYFPAAGGAGGAGGAGESLALLRLEHHSDGVLRAISSGIPGQAYEILISSDLIEWLPWSTAQASDNGRIQFHIPHTPTQPKTFFQLRTTP